VVHTVLEELHVLAQEHPMIVAQCVFPDLEVEQIDVEEGVGLDIHVAVRERRLGASPRRRAEPGGRTAEPGDTYSKKRHDELLVPSGTSSAVRFRDTRAARVWTADATVRLC